MQTFLSTDQQMEEFWVDRRMCQSQMKFSYIAVAPYVVSLVLIWVDNGIQRPVYYVSKSLHEAEVRYLPLEKAILVVVLGTRKLPHYFQAYTVVILT